MPIRNRILCAAPLFLLLTLLASVRSHGEVSHGQTPVAQNDQAATDDQTPVTIDLLANDSDPDGDLLVFTVDSTTCSDGSQPVVRNFGDGAIELTPQADSEGICTVHYQVSDGSSPAQTAQVAVTITRSMPPIDPDQYLGLLEADPASPHYFSAQGVPVFLAGYYPGIQALLVDHPSPGRFTHGELIDQLAGYDINLLRVVLTMGMALEDNSWLHPYRRSGGGQTDHAAELGITGHTFDLNQINTSLLDTWEQIASYAQQQGVYLQIALFDGFHHQSFSSFDGNPDAEPLNTFGRKYDYFRAANNSNGHNGITADGWCSGSSCPCATAECEWYQKSSNIDRQIAFTRAAVARLCSFDNIIWETSNEPRGTPAHQPLPAWNNRSWHQIIRDTIVNEEMASSCDTHLVMPFDAPEHRDVPGHWTPGRDNSDQDYLNVHIGIANLFSQDARPLIADNDCCIEPGTVEQLRKKAWLSVVSGAQPSMLVYDVPTRTLADQQVRDGMRHVGLTRRILLDLGVDLATMTPDDNSLASRSTEHIWAATTTRGEWLVYFYDPQGANPGSATIADPPNDYQAWWVDPSSGNQTPAAANSQGAFDAAAQGNRDWVLYVRDADGQPPVCPLGDVSFTRTPAGSITEGTDLTFDATVSGTNGATVFTWFRDGQAIGDDPPRTTGATTASLALAPAAVNDTGSYHVRVSQPGICTKIAPEQPLSVNPAPTCPLSTVAIDQVPVGTVTVGSDVRLEAVVSGTDAMTTFAWTRNGQALADDPPRLTGAATPTLSFVPATLGDAGSYRVTVSQPGICDEVSPAHALAVGEGTSPEVLDSFTLDGDDRDDGLPLHGTLSETGARVWTAHGGLVFGAGGVTVADPTIAGRYAAGVSYDPSFFPTTPVLTISTVVRAGRGDDWAAIGFSPGPLSGLWGQGLVWMRIDPSGTYRIRTRGHADAPLAAGVATDFVPGGPNTIRLELDTATGTVSAWVGTEQVLYGSYLPGDWTSWLTFGHAAIQVDNQAGPAAGAQVIDDFAISATATATTHRAPFLGLPTVLPGTLEGWHFDLGGEGITYHDADAINDGNVERDSAGIEGTDLWLPQGSSSVQVQQFESGEWLEHTVATTAGEHAVAFEVAGAGGAGTVAGTIGIAIGEGPLIGGPWSVPGTGGNIATVTSGEPVLLPSSGPGGLRLRVRVLSGAVTLRRLHVTPWIPPLVLDDDVVVLDAPPTAEAIDFPLAALLAGDEPAGDLEITAIPVPWVRLNDNGTATYFPGLRGFFSRGWDRFPYQAAHVDDPSVTAEASVTLLAGGLVTEDDHAVTLCPSSGPASQLFIPFADLLANDTPDDPALVAITDVAQQPTGGVGTVTVDATNDHFVFQPTTTFCATSSLPSFRYRSVLIEDPTVQTTGTVWLHGNNPVVALDDSVDFVFTALASPLEILHDEILANDEPADLSIRDDLIGPSQFGATFGLGNGFTRMTPDSGFWARGYDIVDYTAEITAGLSDDGKIFVRAVPKAGRDTVLVPFSPGLGALTLDGDSVLANDGPQLSPPVIDVFGASDGAHGSLDAFAGDLLYTPTEGFWRDGTDAAEYEVWYLDSSKAAARADMDLVAAPAFHAVDRAWALPNLDDPFIFFQSQLLATDLPTGKVVFDSFDAQTLVGGTLSLGGDCGGLPCGKMEYDPPTSGQLPLGHDRLTYRIRLADGPADTRTGHVYLFAGALPPLAATDDTVVVDADTATAITFATLTANDVGQGGALRADLVQAPIHGSIAQAADRFVYTPEPGFVGADFFRYTAVEAATGRRTAPVTVEIAVDHVLIPADDHYLIAPETPGQALSVADLLANDIGAPGDVVFEHAGRPGHGTLLDFGDELVYHPDAVALADAGKDNFTYSVVLADDGATTARATVHLEADLGCSNGFADGFESGDLSVWDLSSALGSTLVVDETAAFEGQYGLTAVLHDDAVNAFVHDNSPTAEVHFRSQLQLDLDGLDLPEGGRFAFVNARAPSTGAAYHLEVDRNQGQRRIRAKALRDDNSQMVSDWVDLRAGSHSLIVDWWAAAAPELDDGGLRLYLDRHLVADLDGLDNDQRRIEQVRFGAIFGIDPRTVGPMRFDDYRSCRGNRTPVLIGEDDFEDGDLVGWNGVTAQGGGTIQPSATAALTGQIGLEVALVPGTQALYLEDGRPANEHHFWTSFRFDPNSLPLDRGDSIRLLAGEQPGGSPFLLFFGRGDGGLRMLLGAQEDDGTFSFGTWVQIPDQPIDLMVAWRASDTGNGLIGSGTPSGHLRLWVDGALVTDMQGLDNDTLRVDRLRLGARQGLPSGPGGSLYFDDYRSWSTP